MMHGYAALMQDYNKDIGRLGRERARKQWRERLSRLAPDYEYEYTDADVTFIGDFLSKLNPLWQDLGITRFLPESDRITVANTGGTRARAGRALRQYLGAVNTSDGE